MDKNDSWEERLDEGLIDSAILKDDWLYYQSIKRMCKTQSEKIISNEYDRSRIFFAVIFILSERSLESQSIC